jgi:hypothetical protein
MALKEFLFGSPEKRENVSTLRPDQEPLARQAINAGLKKGAGGAFGDTADYFRNLMSDDSEDYKAFAAPALRQYNEDIVPGLSEQFAGMGAGGLNSSAFRNAQIQGATDLSERLGSLRANLRMHGAQGLQNIGQQGLQNFSQNMVTQQGSEGFAAPAIGAAASAFGGPLLGAAAQGATSWLSNKFGKSDPYGNNGPKASPGGGSGGTGGGFQLPNFLQR